MTYAVSSGRMDGSVGSSADVAGLDAVVHRNDRHGAQGRRHDLRLRDDRSQPRLFDDLG